MNQEDLTREHQEFYKIQSKSSVYGPYLTWSCLQIQILDTSNLLKLQRDLTLSRRRLQTLKDCKRERIPKSIQKHPFID